MDYPDASRFVVVSELVDTEGISIQRVILVLEVEQRRSLSDASPLVEDRAVAHASPPLVLANVCLLYTSDAADE